MRCSSLTMPEQTTALNHIIVPKDGRQLSAGPEFNSSSLTNGAQANRAGAIERADTIERW
jgi:hypothetical protein